MMSVEEDPRTPEHFRGKEAIQHVVERRAAGVVAMAESHGTEMPGHISAAADATRESAILLLLVGVCLFTFGWERLTVLWALIAISVAWLVWKAGRAAWLGWARLERLHRIIEEERWEIEHHRQQERDELAALYRAKGFEGKLLEEVLDVLMADGDRLLRVMLEEELGLSLEVHEHPLKQAAGAAIGAFGTAIVCLIGWGVTGLYGLLGGALFALAMGGYLSAAFEKNRLLPAIVWNMALGALAFGICYFTVELLTGL